jgi:hypothetical protein
MNTHTDQLTQRALDQADKSRRDMRLFFYMTAIWEAVLMVVFILMADWSDPLHRLIFVSAMLVYGTLGFGLITLGAYARTLGLRVLLAVDRSEDH